MIDRKTYYEAIANAINLPPDFDLLPATEISAIPGWDSFGWVAVIVAIEGLSGKDFPVENIESVRTLDDLFKQIQSA